jgi:hypothetical protein
MASQESLHILPLDQLLIRVLAAGKGHLEKPCAPWTAVNHYSTGRFTKVNLRFTTRRMLQTLLVGSRAFAQLAYVALHTVIAATVTMSLHKVLVDALRGQPFDKTASHALNMRAKLHTVGARLRDLATRRVGGHFWRVLVCTANGIGVHFWRVLKTRPVLAHGIPVDAHLATDRPIGPTKPHKYLNLLSLLHPEYIPHSAVPFWWNLQKGTT